MNVREQAHRDATRLTLPAIAGKLEQTLGQQITAYAVGVKDPRAIGKYSRGQKPKTDETARRLRDLYALTQVLLSRETAETVRAWMIGAHPLLEDRAPVELLHEENTAPVARTADSESRAPYAARSSYQSVVDAAVAFIGA
jgi:hypothetical protein